MALLYADTTGVKPLSLALGTYPQIGDPVATIGSPEGLGGSLSTGVISGFRQMGGVQVIQTTAPTSHGSSGGALLDMYGRVLGITSFTLIDSQNINFAYRSYYIYPLLPKKIMTYMPWFDLEAYSEAVKPPSYSALQLANLKGVAVYVADVGDDARRDGLDTNKLRANIEAILKKDNVTVFDSQTASGNSSEAVLCLYIDLSKTSDGLSYYYTFQLDVTENVQASRYTPTFTRANTWSQFSQWSVGLSMMAQKMYEKVDDSVEAFAKDYHNQNPK